jgi:hypothetical protein
MAIARHFRLPDPMRRSAELFVSGAASLPDILRIPGSLDVIFRPWGFPQQRNSIAADTLTAKTPRHWATRCCNSVVCLHQGAPHKKYGQK